MNHRALTPRTNVDTLRKDAKRWLKALRAGDAAAWTRLRAAWPASPTAPALRDVQHALALEYGHESWIALRAALDDLALGHQSHAQRVEQLLRHAWDGDVAVAQRILRRHPDVADDNVFAAAICGHVDGVERWLKRSPSSAQTKGGPLDWPALAYVAYGRLDATNAVAIARLLLDAGADARFVVDDGWENPFTLITGAVGLGEQDRPSHPQARELVALLVDAGASPFDTQALYDVSVVDGDSAWYELLWQLSEARGVADRWRDADGRRIGGTIALNALDYLLGNAVARNHRARAEWLLDHGASADAPHAYSRQPLTTLARLSGFAEMAALLERRGARPATLSRAEAFQAACLAVVASRARALIADDPALVREPAPLLAAARLGNARAVALLLSLGAPVGGQDHDGASPLHRAVQSGSLETVDALLAAGADVDRRDRRWRSTPLGWAAALEQPKLAQRLAPLSRDVRALARLGLVERLDDVLRTEPALANDALRDDDAPTPLFCLPDDEDLAVDVADILLRHGAKAGARNARGQTAADVARSRGLDDAADLIDA